MNESTVPLGAHEFTKLLVDFSVKIAEAQEGSPGVSLTKLGKDQSNTVLFQCLLLNVILKLFFFCLALMTKPP